jgi:16S rRNA (guanine527-N7)-methyltransferase
VAARDFKSRLSRRAGKIGVYLSDELVERLDIYYQLLSRWNHKINLTSLVDPDEAIDRLLLEPIVAGRHFRAPDVALMDVGSGAGSPAIPMKLSAPSIRLLMVEVKARKSAFLREAVRHLGLTGTEVETNRYEELLARPELHESFDVLSVRAVRIESRTLVTLQAFVKPGGSIFLFRGPAGPDAPASLVPPLEWQGTFPLIGSLQSRLMVLRKRGVFHVEHI